MELCKTCDGNGSVVSDEPEVGDLSELYQHAKQNPLATLIEIDRELCRKHFYHMVRKSWKIATGEDFVDGWHIAAISYHLQALWENKLYTDDGQIADTLVINLPPGCSKSTISSVEFPAWLWAVKPSAKMWYESYQPDLSVRDAAATRKLIRSQWYQDRFWQGVAMSADQDQKTSYSNTEGGWRLSLAIGMGGGFGWHPEWLLVDDPHHPQKALTTEGCELARRKWREVFSSRGVGKNVKRVVIAQRLGELDLSASVLQNESRVVHLKLPMWFDPDDVCETHLEYYDLDDLNEDKSYKLKTSWRDPRTKRGELLFPQFLDDEKVKRLQDGLINAHMISAQMQQNPTSPEGDFFQKEWFHTVDSHPMNGVVIRAWDKASSTGRRADYTAGVLVLFDGDYFYIVDVVRGKWERKQRDEKILEICQKDASKFGNYTVLFEQEPGSGGKDSAEISASQIRKLGLQVRIDKPTSKKIVRWDPLASKMANGQVKIVKGTWNEMFIAEMLSAGPDGVYGMHDDMIDAAASAVRKAAKNQSFNRINRPLLLLTPEEQSELNKPKHSEDDFSRYLELTEPVEHLPLNIKW